MDYLQSPNTLQYIIGFLALVFSLLVVWNKNPVVSAVCLMGTMFMTAGLYLALGSYFMGAVQILIYAGAIAVLFVFIVMLLDVKSSSVEIPGRSTIFAISFFVVGTLVSFFLIYAINSPLLKVGPTNIGELGQEAINNSLNAKAISNYFLSKHMIPFQATGFIILAAILGVVFLARKSVPTKSVEDV